MNLFIGAAVLSLVPNTAAIAQDDPDQLAPERVIECEVTVNASRAEVWRTITTTEGVTTFFAPNANVELRTGGAYEMYFNPDVEFGTRGSEGCQVLSYVPREMLSFTWNAPPSMPDIRTKRTFVVIQLTDAEDGHTMVRLTNGGYGPGEAWDEALEYFQRAWPWVLENLRKRFDEGPRWSESERMTIGPPAARSHYVYLLHPVRDGFMESPTEAEQAAVSKHAAYIRGLLGANRVVFAGPSFGPTQFPDGEGTVELHIPAPGIVVFTAESDEEALAIMENDPAVQAGVFKACVNRFYLSFERP